ncbi:uncharacterized protein LOC110931851 [Helianthus annuus]|uniref:uncharacterized protein LOC110931851 n=1 Tax=Helianthus annuus TaxID=4232 RepID=UPI000B8FBE07|nr:uncharacterized protein LOC110931851 [Helianthus annuus]
MRDYFSENPLYNDAQFRHLFRMSRGFSGIQKCIAAIRQLPYDTARDAWDEYLRISARSCLDYLENFCEGVNFLYGRRYLRMPTATDFPFLYEAHQRIHGFLGMLGSLDCTH